MISNNYHLKIDLNFHKYFSEEYKIMSVPVLLIMDKDKEVDRIYAFQSVPYLLEKLKMIDELLVQ